MSDDRTLADKVVAAVGRPPVVVDRCPYCDAPLIARDGRAGRLTHIEGCRKIEEGRFRASLAAEIAKAKKR